MQEMLKFEDILGYIIKEEGAFDCRNIQGFKASTLFTQKRSKI